MSLCGRHFLLYAFCGDFAHMLYNRTSNGKVKKKFKLQIISPIFFSVEKQSLFEVHAILSQLWIFDPSQNMRSQMIITLDYLPIFSTHMYKNTVYFNVIPIG